MLHIINQLAAAMELPDAVMYAVADTTYALFKPALVPFEAALQELLPSQLAYAQNMTATHQFTTRKPLPFQNPAHAVFAVTFYFVALAALYLLGKVTGKLSCRMLGTVHNTFLFLLSLYMWSGIAITALSGYSRIWNNAVKNETDDDWRMAKLTWVFMVSKLPEYGDTFLMMLKQNYHQVSFLHLYHHSSIFVIWFWICVVGPGGDAYWSAMLNSGVHVVMYGYYAGTMIFNDGPVRKFLNSIKFMITKGQMTQFACNAVQSVYLQFIAETCFYNIMLVKLLFWYMLSLLALFGNFLIKGQKKAKTDAKKTDKKKR